VFGLTPVAVLVRRAPFLTQWDPQPDAMAELEAAAQDAALGRLTGARRGGDNATLDASHPPLDGGIHE